MVLLCMSMFLCHGASMSVSVSLCLSLCHWVCMSMVLWIWCQCSMLYLYVNVSVNVSVSMCLYVIMFVCQCFCVKMFQVHLRPDSWPSGWCRPLKRPTNHPQHWQPDYCKNPHLLTCKIRSLNSRGTCICMRLALMLKWYVRTRLP